MNFLQTPLTGVYIIKLEPIFDDRGAFSRIFCKEEFKKINYTKEIVQINYSANHKKGTIRGLHYQVNPGSEIKIIRCVRGRVFDVIVDIREGSPGFLKSFALELTGENWKMIYVPEGFAHGFQTLEDNCELLYQHTNYYKKEHERGLRFDDPMLGIEWPLEVTVISEKDSKYELLNENFNGIKI